MPQSDKPRDRARSLRRAATDAEKELWWHLRRKLPLDDTYFRRQVPIGPYFADFACFKHRLVIELDGGQHGTEEGLAADAVRTHYLEKSGFRLLRFWNHQVFTEIEGMLETIWAAIEANPSPPTLSARERGEEPRPSARMIVSSTLSGKHSEAPLPRGEG